MNSSPLTPLDLSLALILGAIASTLCLALLGVVFSALFEAVRGGSVHGKLRKAGRRILRADELIEQKRFVEAVKELQKGIIFEAADRALIQALREHHQNILSRCLLISEETSSRVPNLAEVERLFLERAELQILEVKAREAFHKLRSRREQAGKDMPTWSKGDYEKRIEEIRRELGKNSVRLQSELAKLFSSALALQAAEIIYH
jgi:hypothetical protein